MDCACCACAAGACLQPETGGTPSCVLQCCAVLFAVLLLAANLRHGCSTEFIPALPPTLDCVCVAPVGCCSHTNSLVSDPLICLLVGSRGAQVQQRVGPNIKAGTVASKAPTHATAADTGFTDVMAADTVSIDATAAGTASTDAMAAGTASTDATAASTQPPATVGSVSPFAEAADVPQQDSGTTSAATRSADDAAPSPTPSGVLQPRPSMMVDITPWLEIHRRAVLCYARHHATTCCC
jgi:hypothetical protein